MYIQSGELQSKPKTKSKPTPAVRTKGVSTAYDKYTLFNSLDPIFQKWSNGEFETDNGQANIKDRIREVTTDVNRDEVENFM